MKFVLKQGFRGLLHLALGAALVVSASVAVGQAKPLAGQTVKIMWIDPLTGLMGPIGSNQLKTMQFFAEKFSASNDENTTQTHATTGTSPHGVCAKSSAAKGRKISWGH